MAISKERLAKLIKTNSIIYYLKFDNEIIQIELKSDFYVLQGTLTDNKLSKYPRKYYELGNLYETKEEAEEYAEFGNVTKTETLKIPNYKQIEICMDNMKRFGLNHSDRVLARIITKDSIYYLKLCKDLDIFAFQLKQTYIGDDLCEQLSSKFPKSLGKVTKENYNEARRICVKLFRGESV